MEAKEKKEQLAELRKLQSELSRFRLHLMSFLDDKVYCVDDVVAELIQPIRDELDLQKGYLEARDLQLDTLPEALDAVERRAL